MPCKENYSTHRINSTTRNLQEILQLQGSSRAGIFQQLFPVSPSILHGRIRLPASLQVFPGPYSTSRLPVNSTRAETAFYAAANIHALPTAVPRHIPTEFYQEKKDSFQKG